MWIEEDPGKRVNLLRTDQALETDPEVIAMSCPFCMMMLSDGIRAKDLEDKVQTLDVMEIVEKVAGSAEPRKSVGLALVGLAGAMD